MSTLHIVNKANASQGLSSCLRVLRPGDGLLLIEDGVYLAASGHLPALPEAVRAHVLQEDLQARGIALPGEGAALFPVDYAGFVALVGAYARSVSWS